MSAHRWRHGQHDLPDVPCRLHELHRGAGFQQRPPGVGERGQLSVGYSRHNGPERVPGRRGVKGLQVVELQDGVRDVGPYRRHLLFRQDAHGGQLDEPAALRQAGQARVDETLSRQAVHHHVNAHAARRVEYLLPELRRATVEHVLHAQRAEVCLLGGARGREHLRSRGLRQLDGGQPHPSRAGVDEHTVAGVQSREIERQGCRHEHGRYRRKRRCRDSRRSRCNQLLPCDHARSERSEPQSDHAVAG